VLRMLRWELCAGLGAQVCSELESDKLLSDDGVVIFSTLTLARARCLSLYIYIHILPDIKKLH
jgi:hypothetical protein